MIIALRNTVGRPQSHLVVRSQRWRWYGTSCVNLVQRGGAESGENSESVIQSITTSSCTNSNWGFCFDIDGVLLRYKKDECVGLISQRKKK